ncbi:MAG: hypothetical protein QY304_03365 [Candidatus Paceibacterota bacterium]|nr:MAG: hypothetical protein QY304_03365 [Candidatus Paceibacterota bacterium]
MENKILKIILGLIVAIAILHTVAIYFYLYYELWWFDILMHFVGGFWTVLFFLWLLVFSGAFLLDVERKNPAILSFLATSFLVIVAVFWEIFELKFGLTSLNDFDYIQDTVSDIFSAFAGGLLASLFFFRKVFKNF